MDIIRNLTNFHKNIFLIIYNRLKFFWAAGLFCIENPAVRNYGNLSVKTLQQRRRNKNYREMSATLSGGGGSCLQLHRIFPGNEKCPRDVFIMETLCLFILL